MFLFNVGVRFQSARAAWGLPVARRPACQAARPRVSHAAASGAEAVGLGGCSSILVLEIETGTLDGSEARLFSREKREPHFYLGLF
jgi:hypothetical protein